MSKVLDLYTRIRDYVLVGAAATAVVSSVGWYTTSLKLDNERTARAADLATYTAEQEKYTAAATKAKSEQEQKDNKRYAKAERNYRTLLSKYDAALLRLKGSGSKVSYSNLSQASPGPISSDGPGTDTDVLAVTISYDDAVICTINTVRLQIVQEWATEQ